MAEPRAARTTNSRRTATPAQQTWNKGHIGRPTEGRTETIGRACPAEGCGTLAALPQPSARMVTVAVVGSREPARWYCAGGCEAYGQALAEVRSLEVSS